MTTLAVCAALLLSTSLLAAAIAKLTRPDGIRVTLVALGVPIPFSWVAVYLLIAAEATATTLMLIAPRWPGSAVAVLALFGAFALAGAMSVRARTPIVCACFGDGSASLGRRQLVQFPPAAVLAVIAASYADWTAQTGLGLIALALLAVAALSAWRVFPMYASTRAARLSLRQARIASNELDPHAEAAHG